MLTVPVSLKLVMVVKTSITKDVQQTFLKGSWWVEHISWTSFNPLEHKKLFQDNACYCFCEGNYCNVNPCECGLTTAVPPTDITTGDTNATPTGTMTTGTGPMPTVAPWQCAQCLGAYGKCVDESDNGHSTTCYGSSQQCLYLTKSTLSFLICLHFSSLVL